MFDEITHRIPHWDGPTVDNLSENRVQVVTEALKKPQMGINLALVLMFDHKMDRHWEVEVLVVFHTPLFFITQHEVFDGVIFDAIVFSLFFRQPIQEFRVVHSP